jgi:hypothetical protein
MAMIREVLYFTPVWPDRLSQRQGEAWVKQRLEASASMWDAKSDPNTSRTVLTPGRIPELLQWFQQLRKEGGRINCFGIAEELIDDERAPVEWFTLRPIYEGYCEGVGPLDEAIPDATRYPSVKADRMKRGIHHAGFYIIDFVSERFKAVVEKHGLTGIEFLWCRDTGKYQAPQWYLPVCLRPLGRGLDDPRIDVRRLSGVGYQTLDPRGRHGQFSAFDEQYKKDAGPRDPQLKKLLGLMRSMELLKRPGITGRTFPSYLRKHLPDTDFAFTIRDCGDEFGGNARHRGLALNRNARDLLQSAGVLTDEQCDPVLIVNRPPRGAQDLDRRYGPPEPAFSPGRLAEIRRLEAQAWAAHVVHPKLPPAPNLPRALALLRTRKRQAGKNFARPATPKLLAQASAGLNMAIPAAWQKVLRISNGGRIENHPLAADQACVILPAEKLAKSRHTEAAYYRDIHVVIPDAFLLILETEIGDSIWLDTSGQTRDGDCRVVLMSHETGEEREWSSIADLLEELLLPEEDY